MKSSLRDEIQKEVQAVIEACLNEFEKRAILLSKLNENGYEEEALLLCCCYIEAMGNLYFPDSHSGGKAYNFYRALKNFGEEEMFMHIHLKQLWSALIFHKKLKKIGQKIGVTLKKAKKKFYTEEEVLALVDKLLDREEMTRLTDNLWRGTLAAHAYEWFRNPGVHELVGIKSSTFDEIIFKGKPAPVLDFSLLYKEMLNIFKKLREISIERGTYFGQDFKSFLESYIEIHREWIKLGREKGGEP